MLVNCYVKLMSMKELFAAWICPPKQEAFMEVFFYSSYLVYLEGMESEMF